MAERISDKPVIDVEEYAGRMRYIDSEGYVCVADRPKALSASEKKAREQARTEKRKDVIAERAEAREALSEAKAKAKKEPSVENAEAYEEALAEYNKVMGRE